MKYNQSSYRIVIRVDASLDIGIGHVMRCLTLAIELSKMGAEVEFLCRNHQGNLINTIRQKGFLVHELPCVSGIDIEENRNSEFDSPHHASWLGCDWEVDAQHCTALLDTNVDLLIVDHYAIDARWERAMRNVCAKILCIDDLADRSHDCDILLDQTLFRVKDDYSKLVPENAKLLTGSKYALLRPEFSQFRSLSISRRKQPVLKRILITMGGVDRDNVTGKTLEAIKTLGEFDLDKITVVLGPSAPWLRQVEMLAKEIQFDTEVICAVDNIAELMANSDIAISAGGSTTLERFCMGLPAVTVAIAYNQVPLVNNISKYSLGYTINAVNKIHFQLPKILNSIKKNKLKKISNKTSKLCDGSGVKRVMSFIESELSAIALNAKYKPDKYI